MALCRQMDDAVDGMFRDESTHALVVTDVRFDEGIVGEACDILEGLQVARIGELIQADDVVLWILIGQKSDDMRADEASAAGDEKGAVIVHEWVSEEDYSESEAVSCRHSSSAVRQWGMVMPKASRTRALSRTE